MDTMGRLKIYMKVMFLAAGITLIGNAAYAQRQQSSAGIRFGSNWAAPAGSRDLLSDDNLRGYHLGFYTTINITDFFGIQPEFLFSRRSYDGPRGNYVFPGTEEAFPFYRHNFDYFEIPVFARFNIVRGLHVLAGPQFSNFLGSQERFYGGGREFIRRFAGGNFVDLSGVVGIAYEFRTGLNIGVRYGYGIGRIQSLTNFDRGNMPHQTQGMITIGHTFGGRMDRGPRRDLYIPEE